MDKRLEDISPKKIYKWKIGARKDAKLIISLYAN